MMLERRLIAALAATAAALVIGAGTAMLVAGIAGVAAGALPALGLGLADIGLGLFVAVAQRRGKRSPAQTLTALAVAGAAALALSRSLASPAFAPSLAALLTAALLQSYGQPWIARLLPASLDDAFSRRRTLSILWTLLALLSLGQTLRHSAFLIDPSLTWGSAVPIAGPARHMCMTAYLHAAELAQLGDDNVYLAAHYPAFAMLREGSIIPTPTTVAGMSTYIDDPFEYPPPFLLLPRLALALTHQFLPLRTVWYTLQALGLAAVALWLARWIGGRRGLYAGLLFPALLGTVNVLFSLQFGQFHLPTLLLAMAAMLVFEDEDPSRTPRARWLRDLLGASLLAAATVSKIFPGILVVYLLVRRRHRAAALTALVGVALTLLALLVLGPAPFRAFVSYQLPRIASGEAFAFFRRDAFFVARNQSVYGLVVKLHTLGVPAMNNTVAGAVAWIYSALLVVLTVVAAGRARGQDRGQRALVWLGLLNLAALRSPLAPGAYVVAGTVWLLTLLASEIRGRRWLIALCVPGYLLVTSAPPLPRMQVDMVVSTVGQLLGLAANLYVVLRRSKPAK